MRRRCNASSKLEQMSNSRAAWRSSSGSWPRGPRWKQRIGGSWPRKPRWMQRISTATDLSTLRPTGARWRSSSGSWPRGPRWKQRIRTATDLSTLRPKRATWRSSSGSWPRGPRWKQRIGTAGRPGSLLKKTTSWRRWPCFVQHLGRSALHRAAQQGDAAQVQRLIEAGADVELEDQTGRQRPLHYAAERGHMAVLERLLAAKATVEAEDGDGETPFDVAKERGKEKVMGVLRPARVVLMGRKGVSCDPRPDRTVRDLREEVQKELKLKDTETLELIADGITLQDEQTLGEANVSYGGSITAVIAAGEAMLDDSGAGSGHQPQILGSGGSSQDTETVLKKVEEELLSSIGPDGLLTRQRCVTILTTVGFTPQEANTLLEDYASEREEISVRGLYDLLRAKTATPEAASPRHEAPSSQPSELGAGYARGSAEVLSRDLAAQPAASGPSGELTEQQSSAQESARGGESSREEERSDSDTIIHYHNGIRFVAHRSIFEQYTLQAEIVSDWTAELPTLEGVLNKTEVPLSPLIRLLPDNVIFPKKVRVMIPACVGSTKMWRSTADSWELISSGSFDEGVIEAYFTHFCLVFASGAPRVLQAIGYIRPDQLATAKLAIACVNCTQCSEALSRYEQDDQHLHGYQRCQKPVPVGSFENHDVINITQDARYQVIQLSFRMCPIVSKAFQAESVHFTVKIEEAEHFFTTAPAPSGVDAADACVDSSSSSHQKPNPSQLQKQRSLT
ncbi:unnamed protein product [Durusdinium trenchii]|uniref:Ubiquitin-like domain-containing protein n=1 Tax=Durusdinium trenchii TaxID=1381693 RepID=A0ABP0NZU7_9DINO